MVNLDDSDFDDFEDSEEGHDLGLEEEPYTLDARGEELLSINA